MNTPTVSKAARRTKVAGERGIYYRDTPAGRRYEVTFTDPTTGRQRWQVVDGDLKAARAVRGDKLAKIARGENVGKPSKLTLAEVGEAWLASKTKLRPATVDWYRHARDAYIVPKLGKRKVASVTVDDVARLVTVMEGDGYASWTIPRNAHGPRRHPRLRDASRLRGDERRAAVGARRASRAYAAGGSRSRRGRPSPVRRGDAHAVPRVDGGGDLHGLAAG